MRRIVFALTLISLAAPAHAQEEEGGLTELGRMADRWIESFAAQIAPLVSDLREMIDDLDAYEAPEMLDNGDIIIRRKRAAPEAEAEEGVAL